MTPINKIKPGQRWAFAKVRRGDIEVSYVNIDKKIIYWQYVDYNSNIFDSPYAKFIEDFVPKEVNTAIKPFPKSGPNDDRNFLT